MGQRFEGRNLDEALASASAALGAERWQLRHHVLLEKRGFLGGMKRIVIEVDVNADATPPQSAAPPPPPLVEDAYVAPPTADDVPRPRERSRGPARSEGRERGRDRGRGDRSGGRGDRSRGPRREYSDRYERREPAVPPQSEESAEAITVRDWCETVIDLARFDLVVRTEENEAQILVRLYGRETYRLVEEHGELLDAIQVLANKALVGRKVTKEIELDAEAFKERRLDELEERALEMAARVRIDGREQLLPPMTPIERRIIHIALRDDDEVTTISRGDGFYKRVAILLRSEAEKETAQTSQQEP